MPSSCEEKKNYYCSGYQQKTLFKSAWNKKKPKSIDKNAAGVPNANLFISEKLTPLNSKLAFDCRTLKRDGEIEKCYTINGIVHIAKNNKLMKIYHLKDLQWHFLQYAFENSDQAEQFFLVFGKFLCY